MKRFPLSLSQQNILSLEKALPGTSVNNISTTVRIKGHLDFGVLQESIHRVLENDRSLNIRLLEENGVFSQYYEAYTRVDFPVYDFSNTSPQGIENWELAVTREPIPLCGGPLYRFVLFRDGEGSGGFLVKLHHIVADGWSQIMVCNKVGQTYLELLGGKEVSLAPAPDYELHVEEEQNYLQSKAFQKDAGYWKEILRQSGEASSLKAVNSAAVSPVGRRASFELPQVLNHAIYSYCQEKRVAPFAVFYMALAIYFKRIGGAERFTIGVPIFNRTNYKFKQSTGMFVTTLPFYNEINDEWTLNQFNESLMEAWYEMLRHQRYPFSEIQKMADTEGRLFHIALSYQDSKIYESRDASVMLSGRWHYCGYQMEQLTIHLTNLWDHQRYAVDYDYLAQFFGEEEIASLHNNLCEILNEALSDPDKPIYKLRVLSLEQKEQLLYTFNQTDRYLKEVPVYESLVQSCCEYQNRVAVICNGERMTYGAFLYKSAGYYNALSKCQIRQEDLVAIILPRNAELLAAMVGTLQAGGAFVVLPRELPVERIRRILKQSGAKVVISEEREVRRLTDVNIPILTTEEVADAGTVFLVKEAEKEAADKPLSERLAYVVYTSGSTGEPKGVEITHRNLLNLSQEMKEIYGQGAVLSMCNVGFDAFMLESIVALLNGRTIVLPCEEDLESPERLAALINGHAVGYFSMTPSRLSALMQNSAFCRALRKLESIVCGGEAFPAELLKKIKKHSHARIYNQYGPSEATVAVSWKELSLAERITVGRPMGNCKLYVLDKWMNPLPIGGYGQLYIGGKCVGRGYRNQPELTAEVFRKNPFLSEDILYDTGDVAAWTRDGEIILSGRRDSQVKIRGLRIELQEIVSCLETYPGITTAAVKVCEMGDQQVLGAYYCSEDALNEAAILAHVATYLPKYMIPAFLMRLDRIPMNANGKVEEKSLPLFVMPKEDPGVSLSPMAQQVLGVFRRVLKKEDIYGNSDYFLCGGNSLNAMECVMGIEEETGRKIRIADLYACRTPVRVAAYIGGENPGQAFVQSAVVMAPKRFGKAPKRSAYSLTPIQQGIYVQSLLDPTGLSYNMPGAFLLEEAPDEGKLLQAFEVLLKEEPLLRTGFLMGETGVCANVQENITFEIEKLVSEDFEKACKTFVRPFDLGKAPLLRCAFWQATDGAWYLFLDSHHIIGDGMSTPLLLERLNQAYGEGFLKVERDYYDYQYALEQDNEIEKKEVELAYWKEQLKGLPEVLKLPADQPRPMKFDYKGTGYEYVLSSADSSICNRFCKETGISEFVLFLAAYGVLLSAVSGREDFVIGAPVAGRNLPQTREIVGPFINTLPLRLQPKKELTVQDWLEQVRTTVAEMLDNQQVSLEEILQALHLQRGEQNGLYQVMLTQSPVDEDALLWSGKKMYYQPISTGAVKMDLILEMTKKGDAYVLRFSYATSLFEEDTIALYARSFCQILNQMIRGENKTLDQLKLLAPLDYQKYVEIPNYEVTPFVNLPVHKILQNRWTSMAQETAIIFHGEKYSYTWLEERANRIAQYIENKGIATGEKIGLCLSRTPDMIAAMYGILKAGCAYVFMLPTFPTARLNYMLEIADAKLLFWDDSAKKQLPEAFLADAKEGTLYCQTCILPEGQSIAYDIRAVRSDSLMNVLFTSGSTGQPKGVMLRHRSVSNLYSQMKTLLDPIPGNVLCSTNTVFDCFVVETMIALALGRCVVLADEEEMMLPWKLADLVATYDTGIFEMTPSRLQMCLGNDAFCKAASHIRIVLLGGEVVTRTLMDKFYEHSEGVLMNMYGPTEATVFTTMEPLRRGEHITIGKPLQNTRTYVLDEKLRPVMPTACGELYIGGECVAAGYISRPELTESSFVEDLYFPGEKMYRSGDLVRLRADGRFDYVGRKDAQVKLNGQRVELSEITGAIMESGQVAMAATVAVRKEDGSMELCAFYEKADFQKRKSHDMVKEAILTYVRGVLPVYMIPSRWQAMEQLPMTATNKIDLQSLQKMASEGMSAPETEAAEVEVIKEDKTAVCLGEITEEYVLSVWNKVLSTPAKETETSFFVLGGTSMGALNVLSHYFNAHLEMSLAEFYEYPTAKKQARLLERYRQSLTTQSCEEEMPEEVPVTQSVGNIRIDWDLGDQMTMSKQKEKAVLVTGGTGFFGVHLVKALLQEGRQVICLLRDGDIKRMQECMKWYFGPDIKVLMKDHLKVIKGDISLDYLGMSERDYVLLTARIGEIYHCAADVRHYVAEEESYIRTNTIGTENMLKFARWANAVFYHMSTLSVSGEHMRNGVTDVAEIKGSVEFTEKDYDIGQIWEENIYVKSKFLAEGLVLKAFEQGLRGKIFRLGRLVGRAADGKFQRNPQRNVFYLLMKGFRQVGVIPESAANAPVDLMPVDTAVEEVLALTQARGLIYHIMSHTPPTLQQIVRVFPETVAVVDEKELITILQEKAGNLDKELTALLMDHWHRLKTKPPQIQVQNTLTVEHLEQLGRCPRIPSPEQILKEF